MAERILILNEHTVLRSDETGAARMRNRCAFTARDLAADWAEAFTYAVVYGWNEAESEVAERYGWDAELVAFLRETHERFKTLADRSEVSRG